MASIVSPADKKNSVALKSYSALDVHSLFLPLSDVNSRWGKEFVRIHNQNLETLVENRTCLRDIDYAREVTKTHYRVLLSKTGKRGAADPANCEWFAAVGIYLLRTAVAHHVANQMRLYAMKDEQPSDDLFDYTWTVGFEVPAQHIAIALQALHDNPDIVIEDWSTCYEEVFDPRRMKPMVNLVKAEKGFHLFKNPRTHDHEMCFPYDEFIVYAQQEVSEQQIRASFPEFASAFIFEHTRMHPREPFHVRIIPAVETGLVVPVDGRLHKVLSWESMLLEKACSKWRSGHRMICEYNHGDYCARGLLNYQHPIKWTSLPRGLLLRDMSEIASLMLNYLAVRIDWDQSFDHHIGQSLASSKYGCPLTPVNFMALMTTGPTAPIVLVARKLVGRKVEVFFTADIDEKKHDYAMQQYKKEWPKPSAPEWIPRNATPQKPAVVRSTWEPHTHLLDDHKTQEIQPRQPIPQQTYVQPQTTVPVRGRFLEKPPLVRQTAFNNFPLYRK